VASDFEKLHISQGEKEARARIGAPTKLRWEVPSGAQNTRAVCNARGTHGARTRIFAWHLSCTKETAPTQGRKQWRGVGVSTWPTRTCQPMQPECWQFHAAHGLQPVCDDRLPSRKGLQSLHSDRDTLHGQGLPALLNLHAPPKHSHCAMDNAPQPEERTDLEKDPSVGGATPASPPPALSCRGTDAIAAARAQCQASVSTPGSTHKKTPFMAKTWQRQARH
jgi:hypothetical protein